MTGYCSQKIIEELHASEVGKELHRFASELYPICRSISGGGLRQTLRAIADRIPMEVHEVPTGTQVFDWIVPKEWNIRDAFIRRPNGPRVVDFKQCNLHVLNYSTPVHAMMSLTELKKHLFTLPDRPEWIPYRTSYYREDWGFCVSHKQMLDLEDGEYEVCIDSSLTDGSLTYGECYLPGYLEDEVLISCHVCHPSLANDNLSGLTVATRLAQFLAKAELRYSYRFLFIPGTIGAITWLSLNRETIHRVRHGLVLTCIGDAGGFHYKRTRKGDAQIDRIVAHVLQQCQEQSDLLEFSPFGYDERQYCSPGFDLPVGCLMRSVWGTFPEYHTSADNLDFVKPSSLAASLHLCAAIVNIIENNRCFQNLQPYCEPQLSKRNLYSTIGGRTPALHQSALLWVLNLSDGKHSILDIAERSGMDFETILHAANVLKENGLLGEVDERILCNRPSGATRTN